MTSFFGVAQKMPSFNYKRLLAYALLIQTMKVGPKAVLAGPVIQILNSQRKNMHSSTTNSNSTTEREFG